MKSKSIKLIVRSCGLAIVAMTVACSTLNASVTDDLVKNRDSRSADVTPGRWHADLEKARAYAEANGLPLMAVWSNGDFCQHCLVWEGSANSTPFAEWMAKSGIVFYFGYVKDGSLNEAGDFGKGPSPDGKEGYHGTSFYWCCNGKNSTLAWPYVRFYWPKGNVDYVCTGSDISGEYAVKGGLPCMVRDELLDNPTMAAMYAPWVKKGDFEKYNPGGRFMLDFITNKTSGIFKDFTAQPLYCGGAFDVLSSTSEKKACLQVEKNTTFKSIIVPLIRKESTIRKYKAKNYVVCTYPNGATKTVEVNWAEKQKVAEMPLEVSQELLESSAQSPSIKMELYDQDMVKKATCRVDVVDQVANSAANPLWIGERTASSLAWGEWTMDIDVAKQKVKNTVSGGNKAYLLVLVNGSLWRKECYDLHKYLLAKTAFNLWAQRRNVACVEVDVPRFAEEVDPGIPSLLSHAPYISATYGVISGSCWLGRHAVPLSGNNGINAASVLERNLAYATNDTTRGGFCLPESAEASYKKTHGWKVGVPCILFMRADGSIIGRIYQFSNDTSSLKDISVTELVKRLDEVVSQAEESVEESNDSPSTTNDSIQDSTGTTGTTVKARLSFADQADYYKIKAGSGASVSFTLSSIACSNLVVSIVNGNAADPDTQPIASATNTKGQVTVKCTLPVANCYAKVSYPVDSNGYPSVQFFELGKSGSTICDYTINGSGMK